MPLAAETLPAMTPEQYLAFERESERRHELVDGYLYAMPGASDRHEEIAGNLLAAIHADLRGKVRQVRIAPFQALDGLGDHAPTGARARSSGATTRAS